jgi:hypothetical protein
MNSTVSNHVLSQKTVAISCVIGRQHLFKILFLLGECVCIQGFDCSLGLTFTNETQVSSPVIRSNVIEKFIAIFVTMLQKFKAKAIFCALCAPVIIFGTHLAQKL